MKKENEKLKGGVKWKKIETRKTKESEKNEKIRWEIKGRKKSEKWEKLKESEKESERIM